jgi:hypothetical protein
VKPILALALPLFFAAGGQPVAADGGADGGASRPRASGEAATPLERARALERARDWAGLADFLGERARRVELPPDEERLYAAALEGLGRADEAAHHMERAAVGFERAGRESDGQAAVAAVRRLDPLAARRDPFLRKVAATLADAAEELLSSGDAQRALELAAGLPRIARGKAAREAAEVLARARAAFAKVDLEGGAPAAAPENPAEPGARPPVERESRHYRLVCHLEPEVVERLATLMDDVHAFYVRVYFDGDARQARGARATIHVAPDKAAMLARWPGAGEPEGWWSPGTNEVHAYDTRAASGSLDDMLETLFHEASHQFMTLLAGGSAVPAWLNEGTSSFFEGTVAMADGRVLWPRAALRRLASLQHQIASRRPPTLRDVVEYSAPGSYDASYYAWGWGLVYYLLEYEDPATLDRPYRALYSGYRDEVATRGGATFAAFERWFLGDRSPRHHTDFASFARDWETWILDEVGPLHGRDARARELRLARIERLMAAAEAPAKDGPRPAELLERALVHFEWVRSEIDRDAPDGGLLLRQADVFERLKRAPAAAALVEQALDLADAGRHALDAERRAELERRLAQLDRRNAALRTARVRSAELARTGLALVADYREAGSVLRAYTLAADLSLVLGEPLAAVTAELRAQARAQGLLRGAIRALSPRAADWSPVMPAGADRFEPDAGRVLLGGVRAAALVDGALELPGEYVVRARLVPQDERRLGSAAGFVVAGAPERGSTLVAVDERGLLGLWSITPGAGPTLRRTRTIAQRPAVAAGAAFELAVRVKPDGTLWIELDGAQPVEARLDHAPLAGRRAGLFAKNGAWVFEDPRVELVP